MDLKNRFEESCPGKFFLQKENPNELENYLKQNKWLKEDDKVGILEKPGEGNMNFVLRVIPESGKSFIIKQSRPWVEKYPQIVAPIDRIKIESEYRQCDRGWDRRGVNSERIEPQRRVSYQPPTEEDIAFNAALEKELREFQLAEQEIQERERQEIVNITTISGRKQPRHLSWHEAHVPAETDIKLLESVYNMFNIQSEQIKALEVEIQELKKINRLFHQHSQKN